MEHIGIDLNFKTTSVEYGLVPMPKGPDIDHYVNVLGGVRCFSIFACNPNIKDIATVLAYMGTKFTDDGWEQGYCENDLQGDEEALEMVTDYIWPNTVVDYCWCSSPALDTFRNDIYLPITRGENSPTQMVESGNAKFQADIDEILNK